MAKGLRVVGLLIMCCLSTFGYGYAQQDSSDNQQQEVYLSFRHRGAVDRMISSYYDSRSQTFYLPVTQLFNTLGIDYNVDQQTITVRGSYLDTGSEYVIALQQQYAEFQDTRLELQPDDYLIKELDFYVRPQILADLLDLNFEVDFSSLSISLESPYTMPVVAQMQRQRRRQQEMETYSVQREDYPLRYEREQEWLDGGFLDYNLSSNVTDGLNYYSYNFDLGAELFAGDVQGSVMGSWSDFGGNYNTNNLRWRYVMRDNPWVSRIRVGQSVSDGIQSRAFTGLKISNEPIEPRISFDEYVVQGQTRPQSEVELYLNDNLIDYQEADELGNYRFVIPLTYGSSRLRVRIYGPDGMMRERNERIQVPFNFNRPGELRYSVSAGRMDRSVFGTSERSELLQSEVRMGVNRNLTVGGGFEYLDQVHDQRPLMYGTLSSRIFTNYLVNADIAPDAYYRLQTNTVYGSSAGWGVDYTYYPDDNFYNRGGYDHQMSGNFYVPFHIGPVRFNTRLFSSHLRSPGVNTTRYRLSLNSRVSRVTMRLGYSDQQLGPLDWVSSSQALLTGNLTYTLSGRSMPDLLQGTFLRGNVEYNPNLEELRRAGVQLSRNISQTGRVRVSYDRNFRGGFNSFNVGLTFNFNKIRTTSTFRSGRRDVSYTQNLRGTIGFDGYDNDFVLDGRQQVGRSAASVRLFLDENNNQTYEEGEKLIQDNAMRLRRSGDIRMGEEGKIYMMQLQSYNRLNAEINESAITNPLYIPETKESPS